MILRSLSWVLTALFILLLPLSANAEKGPRERASTSSSAKGSDASGARELFGVALLRIQSGRFAEARDLLEESLALTPRAGTAFNLAVANRGAGDLLKARELLDELLQGKYGELSSSQEADARGLHSEIKSQIGKLQISVEGTTEAEVRVDGERAGVVRSGQGPLQVEVDPGRRLVSVSAPDYKEEEREVRVEPGEKVALAFALALTEEARTGRLIVDSANKTDQIEIVGIAKGQGHLDRRVAPGHYTVRVSNSKGSTKTKLSVEPRGTVRYQFDEVNLSLYRRPLFWAGVGVLVAGVVLTAILIRPRDDAEPVSDPTYGVVKAGFEWR